MDLFSSKKVTLHVRNWCDVFLGLTLVLESYRCVLKNCYFSNVSLDIVSFFSDFSEFILAYASER